MFDHIMESNNHQQQYTHQSWTYQENNNYQSMQKYINSLIEFRSRLLVVRIDLGFRVDSPGQYDAEYARSCFQRLMNNRRRNSIFKHELGYIWALEYGHDKGFHYHLFFFFDGHMRQQDRAIGHLIGQYWNNELTEGMGSYFCSNDRIEQMRAQGCPIGIGMIHREDLVACENLRQVATYLLKESDDREPNLRSLLPDSMKRFRTFGRGEIN